MALSNRSEATHGSKIRDEADPPDFDETDFAKHLRNVLDDLRYGMIDVDQAFEAIMKHPACA